MGDDMPVHDQNETQQKFAKTIKRARFNIGCFLPLGGALTFGSFGCFVGATFAAAQKAGGDDAKAFGGIVGALAGAFLGLLIGASLATVVDAVLDWMVQMLITQEEIREKLSSTSTVDLERRSTEPLDDQASQGRAHWQPESPPISGRVANVMIIVGGIVFVATGALMWYLVWR